MIPYAYFDSIYSILNDSTIVLTEDTAPEDVDGWDSVTHVIHVTALEEKYDVKLFLRERMCWETIGDLADIILNKVKNG